MSFRFDTKTNAFSAEGHLEQVEFAIESVKQCPAVVVLKSSCSVYLFAESVPEESFLADSPSPRHIASCRKLRRISPKHICAFAGLASDAETLVQNAKRFCSDFYKSYDAYPSAYSVAANQSSLMQKSTQSGGQRPFGVEMLTIGFSKQENKFELLSTNPAGNFFSLKAAVIGKGSDGAKILLQEELKHEMDEKDLIILGLKALKKALGGNKLNNKKVQIAVLEIEKEDLEVNLFTNQEIKLLLSKVNIE